MAIVKHQASKNANYGSVLDYYTLKHEEIQGPNGMIHKTILDEFGHTQPRENYAICYISADGKEKDPQLWQTACLRTNMLFKKNQNRDDRKSHEYIISHPEEDRPWMTTEDLMDEGRAFAEEYFKGYDVLIVVHRDTDNDHIHISINSVRALDLEREEPWMERDKQGRVLASEMKAGCKHQQGPALIRDMNDWLCAYSIETGLIIEDNNAKADENKRLRHGNKNDQMRMALLRSAKQSRNMQDLQRVLKKEYDMELKIRGNTISVLHPENAKAVRLRTLELEVADLTRLMQGSDYKFTEAARESQLQKEIEEEEKKKYIEWIKDRRQRNNERAENAIMKAEDILANNVRARGERYNKNEFQDLRYLIKQCAYLESDLNTEMEKLDRLLERWNQYRNFALPEQERRKHAGYVKWCGCDPDSALELEDLKAEREIIETQQREAAVTREALVETAERWKGHNAIERAENDVLWAKQRKQQLRQQLRSVKASRKRLKDIYHNCRKAIGWDLLNKEKWERVDYYRDLWRDKVRKQKEIEEKIRDVKQKQRDAKKLLREERKRAKEAQTR